MHLVVVCIVVNTSTIVIFAPVVNIIIVVLLMNIIKFTLELVEAIVVVAIFIELV